MVSERSTWYLYRGRGLLEVVGPIGSGRQLVGGSEWVSRCGGGRYKRRVYTRLLYLIQNKAKVLNQEHKVHYRFQNRPPFASILSQINPVHTLPCSWNVFLWMRSSQGWPKFFSPCRMHVCLCHLIVSFTQYVYDCMHDLEDICLCISQSTRY